MRFFFHKVFLFYILFFLFGIENFVKWFDNIPTLFFLILIISSILIEDANSPTWSTLEGLVVFLILFLALLRFEFIFFFLFELKIKVFVLRECAQSFEVIRES